MNIDVQRPITVGLVLVLAGFGGFLVWAGFAPLTSAAIAPGMVVADSRNKAIQHLEGGIIREVLVREGDEVAAGTVLARLDSAMAEASLGRLEAARRESLVFRDEVIPRSEQALKAAQAAWQGETGSFYDVMESRRMLLDAELMHARAISEQWQMLSELVLCCGLADLEALEMLSGQPLAPADGINSDTNQIHEAH